MSTDSPRSVWIFARPLSLAGLFPPLGLVSHGKYHLCHWGVLVTERSIAELKTSFLGIEKSEKEEVVLVLGVMWELNRIEGNRTTVNCTRPFTISSVKEQWSLFSAEFLGETQMNDNEIWATGTA
jgi:hypothetical protein